MFPSLFVPMILFNFVFLLVPVSGDFSGAWVVQKYSVLQCIYYVFFFENVCFTHSPQTNPLGSSSTSSSSSSSSNNSNRIVHISRNNNETLLCSKRLLIDRPNRRPLLDTISRTITISSDL